MVLVIVIILTNNKNKKYSIFSKGGTWVPLRPLLRRNLGPLL